MIYPYCHKPIKQRVSSAVKSKAIVLARQGYSTRDIEKILAKDGMQISFATVSRLIKKESQ